MLNLLEKGTDDAVRSTEVGRDLVLATWTPGPGGRPSADVAERAYRALRASLSALGCVPVQERVFGPLEWGACLQGGRARAVGCDEAWAVPPTLVEGAPVRGEGLAGIHVVAARGAAKLVREGDHVFGRVVEGPEARVIGLSDVARRAATRLAAGPAEEAGAAIDSAGDLLAREGFSFRDVARTWFYLRDILEWYGAFNAVRNAAFRRRGLIGPGGDGRIPASTGIEGRNARGGWCALDLLAVQPSAGGGARLERLHSRRQNEATEYGSAFARGLALTVRDARYVFVSGTASIDDHGATVYVGDFEAQTRQTLDALAAVLERGGARLSDVRQATVFLKDAGHAPAFESLVARSGLAGCPLVTTVADVCRDDLLVEIDATAVVPTRDGWRR
jgi:enamine deaminase RidA (YjgF/YER057c/UK114 family)